MRRFLVPSASSSPAALPAFAQPQHRCIHSILADPSAARKARTASKRRASAAAQPAVKLQPDAQPDADDSISRTVAMLGAGNMGGAMMQGWLAAGVTSGDRMAACVRSEESMLAWDKRGVQVFSDVSDEGEASALAEFADVIFLGVKPKFLAGVLEQMAPHLSAKHLVVSIAAGWPMEDLEAALPEGTRVVRVMPNTPILAGHGASVFALGTHATDEDRQLVATLLNSCGVALEIEEDLIDAAIGVSGSGPAYMFATLEAMSDGGVRAGLPRQQALLLAAQTMKGAAEMVLNGGGDLRHPGMLKDQVTSPAGTTITALSVLEEEGVRSAFIKAVTAAAEQSKAMAAAR